MAGLMRLRTVDPEMKTEAGPGMRCARRLLARLSGGRVGDVDATVAGVDVRRPKCWARVFWRSGLAYVGKSHRLLDRLSLGKGQSNTI